MDIFLDRSVKIFLFLFHLSLGHLASQLQFQIEMLSTTAQPQHGFVCHTCSGTILVSNKKIERVNIIPTSLP